MSIAFTEIPQGDVQLSAIIPIIFPVSDVIRTCRDVHFLEYICIPYNHSAVSAQSMDLCPSPQSISQEHPSSNKGIFARYSLLCIAISILICDGIGTPVFRHLFSDSDRKMVSLCGNSHNCLSFSILPLLCSITFTIFSSWCLEKHQSARSSYTNSWPSRHLG